jgi:hypothetical protein
VPQVSWWRGGRSMPSGSAVMVAETSHYTLRHGSECERLLSPTILVCGESRPLCMEGASGFGIVSGLTPPVAR